MPTRSLYLCCKRAKEFFRRSLRSALLFTFVSTGRGQNGGTWQTLAPMPVERQELATAVLNGKIYILGGYDAEGRSTDTVHVPAAYLR